MKSGDSGRKVLKFKTTCPALLHNGKIKSKVFENSAVGHAAMLLWLLDRGALPATTHLCLEATGPFSEPFALAVIET